MYLFYIISKSLGFFDSLIIPANKSVLFVYESVKRP